VTKTWQSNRQLFWTAVVIASFVLLAGCATNRSATAGDESSSSFAQTDKQKRARIRLQLAAGYYEQHQIAIALDEVRQALQTDPDFADAYSVRGLIYMDMGEARLAEENFLQAIKLAPNNPDIGNNYGWFLCQNGHADRSIAYFEATLKSRAYQSPAKALNNAGVCSLKLKDVVAAERYFIRAFQFDPGNLTTSVNLAKIYYERRDYERARFYIDRVVKADQLTADVLWLAIKVAHKLGDRAAEVSLATQLHRRHPNSPEHASYQRGVFDD
jgi:type IV pilus assembly protein PilF